jgi:hypothetical protein
MTSVPFERAVGEEALPLVGNVGAQIGDDRVERPGSGSSLSRTQATSGPSQMLDVAERHHADAQPLLPLQLEVDDIVPDTHSSEAADELEAAIIEAREEEDRQHDPVGAAKLGRMW